MCTYGKDGTVVTTKLTGAGKYPFLRLSEAVVDLGEVTVGRTKEASFTIINQARRRPG